MGDPEEKAKFEAESLKFLENDFNQCFQQMRHYDSQVTELIKFLFTAYTALIGLAIGLHKYGTEKCIDLSSAVIASLIVGLIIGVFVFGIIIRNRVYYVQVARYVNEQREFYFKYKPSGFENKAGMYTNSSQPPFFNWRSSHSWLSFISAALNAALLGVLIYIIFPGKWRLLIALTLGLFIIQVVVSIIYLMMRENKSASKAVFGKE